MKTMRMAFLAFGPVLAVWFLLAGPCLAATPDEDLKPLKSGVTITGVVEDVDTVRQKLTVKVKMFLGREMPVEVDLQDVVKV